MRTNWTIRLIWCALLASGLPLAPMAMAQTFTLDYPEATATFANDVDTDANVVGTYYDAKGIAHGFLYVLATGTYRPIDYPNADWTQVTGISPQGADVVGYYGYDTDTIFYGFKLSRTTGEFISIERGGHWSTMPQDIAPSGDIVGCVHNPGAMFGWVLHDGAFTSETIGEGWTGATMYTAMDEGGHLVGWYWSANVVRSFVLRHDGYRTDFEYPGASNTQAWDVNYRGCIVGWYGPADASRGFIRWSNGAFSDIQMPGAKWTRALGNGVVGPDVVGAYSDGSRIHGFLTRMPCL